MNRAWWLMPLVVWASLVGTSYWDSVSAIEEHNHNVAHAGAHNMFEMVVLTRL